MTTTQNQAEILADLAYHKKLFLQYQSNLPYEDLDQTLSTAREFRYPVDIDGDIGLRFTLMADTKVRFYMWMDKNASLTNKLLTNESVFEFTKPFPLEAKNPYLVKIIWGEQGSFYVEK